MSTEPTPWVVSVDRITIEAHRLAPVLGITPHQVRVILEDLERAQLEVQEEDSGLIAQLTFNQALADLARLTN